MGEKDRNNWVAQIGGAKKVLCSLIRLSLSCFNYHFNQVDVTIVECSIGFVTQDHCYQRIPNQAIHPFQA